VFVGAGHDRIRSTNAAARTALGRPESAINGHPLSRWLGTVDGRASLIAAEGRRVVAPSWSTLRLRFDVGWAVSELSFAQA
jgi:hypothetical protein